MDRGPSSIPLFRTKEHWSKLIWASYDGQKICCGSTYLFGLFRLSVAGSDAQINYMDNYIWFFAEPTYVHAWTVSDRSSHGSMQKSTADIFHSSFVFLYRVLKRIATIQTYAKIPLAPATRFSECIFYLSAVRSFHELFARSSFLDRGFWSILFFLLSCLSSFSLTAGHAHFTKAIHPYQIVSYPIVLLLCENSYLLLARSCLDLGPLV